MKIKTTDYNKFLDPKVVSKISNLELRARLVVEGFLVGLHKSPYHGFSIEFSEHRPYMIGDDLKSIDWRVFARTEKYFIKQFEEETNLKAWIILDSSRSMYFNSESNIKKLEYAKTLSAALAYLLIKQRDAAGLINYTNKVENILPPKATRNYLNEIIKTLSLINASETTNTSNSLTELAEKIKKRSLIIIISDFFDEIDKTLKALKNFSFLKSEVIVFQILDPIELSFGFKSDSTFIDLETNEKLNTQPFHLRKAYQDAMKDFIDKIKHECLKSYFDYNLITTNEPFDKALFKFVQKRKRLY
ncbi:MAG: DUF58 domain-containing protein [Ignavibacterium sp.]|nr:DUF58 domain-containing protein [Ignavibacterium sp.]MCX7611187.1 DUF58 domain-containing protein [Ignavibacterium sp.]MDW8376247.1 DUF58 domain-containing protein [Ignavibacteriales bacterium]